MHGDSTRKRGMTSSLVTPSDLASARKWGAVRFATILTGALLITTACSTEMLPLPPQNGRDRATPDASSSADTAQDASLEIREFWPLDERFDDYLMPDMVGMHLDEAKELLAEWGPYLNEEDASGDGRRSWSDGNWTVVSQDPLPGKPQRAGQGVDLGILKHEEVGDSLADLPREDRHVYDRVFTGTVTAHGEYVRNLTVDGAEIQLYLIAPVAESCGTELDDGTDTAYSAQAEAIPLDARVLVVRSEQGDDRAFVHVLQGEQLAAEPPLESANEALVRTGWWSPESTRFDGGFGENRDKSISFDVWDAEGSQLSETQAKYAPLIAAAGNEGVDASTTGLGCAGRQQRRRRNDGCCARQSSKNRSVGGRSSTRDASVRATTHAVMATVTESVTSDESPVHTDEERYAPVISGMTA